MKFTCSEIRLLHASRQIKQQVMGAKMDISKRINKILVLLGYVPESARKYLGSIPNPVEYKE